LTVPKKHHLLPRFYLSGFCNPEIHKGEDHERDRSRCRVWVHDKEASAEQDAVRERGVKNLSVERHYCSADLPTGGRDAEPERLLSKVEDQAARITRNLYYGANLSPEDRAELALFAASMKFRVSSFRPWLNDFAQQYVEHRKQHLFPNVEALDDYLQAKGVPTQEMPGIVEQLFADLQDPNRKVDMPKNYALTRMFEHAQLVREHLFSYDWTFAWAADGTSFVTSDDPFLVLDENWQAPSSYSSGIGIATYGAQKLLPLNQHVCLAIGTGAPVTRHIRLNRQAVRGLNLRQANHYARWLIARDQALVDNISGMRY